MTAKRVRFVKSLFTSSRSLLHFALVAVAIAVALVFSPISLSWAQGPGGDNSGPAPASIGADVPLTYFGPPPSLAQQELVGPVQLLKAGTVDQEAGTITLPLYRGQLPDGRNVWYILTDTTDEGNARALGLNFAPKLAYSAVGTAVRTGRLEKDASITFDAGTVDFSPERNVVPGNEMEGPFPPREFQPGSVGDENYSPLVRIENAGGHIYNAPMVAFDVTDEQISFCDGNPDYSLVHDKVVRICPSGNGGGTVTIALTSGFSFAKPVLYLSTEASDPLAATLEAATYAPALADITVGRDDSAFSAIERIFVTINGPTNSPDGVHNPQRQGLNSALLGEGGPLNVLGGIPTVATDYSPLWDMNLGEWTQDAVDRGFRSRVTEEFQILGLVQQGWITGPGGATYGSVGIIVNCPIAMRFL
jgi:hypothetical protein